MPAHGRGCPAAGVGRNTKRNNRPIPPGCGPPPGGGAQPDATIRDAPRSSTKLSETPIVFLIKKGRSISRIGSSEFPSSRENFGLPRPPRDIPMPHHFPRCHQDPRHDRSYVPEKTPKNSSTIHLTPSKVTIIHGERTTPIHPKHTTSFLLRILHRAPKSAAPSSPSTNCAPASKKRRRPAPSPPPMRTARPA